VRVRPRVREAADAVLAMITDGTLKPGDVVPTTAALHEQTGIGLTACLQGMRLLAIEGALHARRTSRGKLWIVTDPAQRPWDHT
jgi:DNA-binding FadR family transcriptional regulator